MNPNRFQILKFKNVSEVNFEWNLSTGGTVTTTPLRCQTSHTNWMPAPGNNDLQEAIWNNYLHHLLVKYRYRIRSMRLFANTLSTVTSTSLTTPVNTVTETQEELKDWVIWYWRQLNEGDATPPNANNEERYSRLRMRGQNSSISGFVPLNTKRAAMITGTYSDNFGNATGNIKNMDNYLQTSNNYTPVNLSGNTSSVPCGDVWIMPDDPYPLSYYEATTTVKNRQVKFTLMCDIETYATWKCLKPKVN